VTIGLTTENTESTEKGENELATTGTTGTTKNKTFNHGEHGEGQKQILAFLLVFSVPPACAPRAGRLWLMVLPWLFAGRSFVSSTCLPFHANLNFIFGFAWLQNVYTNTKRSKTLNH
jgi:hypothetical protein